MEPAPIQEAAIAQVDSVVVSFPTAVYFSVTTLNPIPPGGGIQVILPAWNQGAPFGLGQSYIVDDDPGQTEVCAAKLGVSEDLTCSVIRSSPYDYITVKDAFPDGRGAGDTFAFYVSKLRNPVSMSPAPISLLTFSGIAFEDDNEIFFTGEIDRGEALFLAQEAASIDPASSVVSATDSTVQTYSDFSIPFKVPLPVAGGCIVLIEIPEDFTVNAGELNLVEGWGIFGTRKFLVA